MFQNPYQVNRHLQGMGAAHVAFLSGDDAGRLRALSESGGEGRGRFFVTEFFWTGPGAATPMKVDPSLDCWLEIDGRWRRVLEFCPETSPAGAVVGWHLEVEDLSPDVVLTVDQAHSLLVVGGARATSFETAAAVAAGATSVTLQAVGASLSQGALPYGYTLEIGDESHAAAADAFVRAGQLDVVLAGPLGEAAPAGLAVGMAPREAREYPAALVARTDRAGEDGVVSRGARLLVPRAPGVAAPRVAERARLEDGGALAVHKVSEEPLGYVVEIGEDV